MLSGSQIEPNPHDPNHVQKIELPYSFPTVITNWGNGTWFVEYETIMAGLFDLEVILE